MRNSVWIAAICLALPLVAGSNRIAVTSAAESPVTFSRQIAPILYKNCTSCHHPGGAGPFSLVTYADARRWAPQIVRVTQTRFMPPWLPEPGYGDFADERRLSTADIDLIRRWANSGMAEGDPAEAPKPPQFTSAWLLGTPDLVLSVQKPFRVPPSGSDVFINFILPYPLQQTHYIRAMEILPGSPKVVHHANVLIDRTASFRHAHSGTWKDGVPGMELAVDSGDSFDPDSHFLFWKPDSPLLTEPEGMPWRLSPGNDLILNMHLKPTGKPEIADAKIGLYFTDKPPTQHPILLEMEHDSALDIPAGAHDFVVQDQIRLPVDVKVLGVYPHAHYLGKDLKGYAILPGGQKKWLLWIRNWDIDRQSVYSYKHPVFLPKGTVLHMRYTYDNSASNIHNPNSPPIRVRAGNRSVDEMGHLWLQVLPVGSTSVSAGKTKDARLLLEHAWMEDRLRNDAGDPIALYNLAAVDLAEGNYDQSIEIDRRLLQHNPADARTLTALGVAEAEKGDWQQAKKAYEQALAANPDSTDTRFDLARLETNHAEFHEAASQFRILLAGNPNDAAARSGLGVALLNEGDIEGARQELRNALAANPQDFTAFETLGQIDISAGQLPQAIERLQAAIHVQNDPDARQLLAMAYAQSGKLEEAADQLRQALRVRPNSAITYALLSRVYSSMSRWNDALAARQRALQLNPDDGDGWNALGVLHVHLNQLVLAQQDFLHALRISPGNQMARANLDRLRNQSRSH
jgi:tetratricopeptide (TPR) repeat protein/mono/diheme cytochrome c family protein